MSGRARGLRPILLAVPAAVATAVVLIAGLAVPAVADSRDEANEAAQATKEEWDAFKNTMTESKAKLEEFKKKYEEYDEFIWDQTNRRDLKKIGGVFGWDAEVGQLFDQTQGVFNELRNSKLKEKLESAIANLDKALGYAKEVDNVWEFAEKWDPGQRHDNPTAGLSRIADILKEGSSKVKALPVVGQVLGAWIDLYADATTDTIAALKRLDKKIQDNVRQHNLCGQHGHYEDEQAAFFTAAVGKYGGLACTEFFLAEVLGKLRCRVFLGQGVYYLYDPGTGQGHFAPVGRAGDVYRWWNFLLDPPSLTAAWLVPRAEGITGENVSEARDAHARMSALFTGDDPARAIAESLGRLEVLRRYGGLGQEAFVANFLLDGNVAHQIRDFLGEIDKYVYAAGRVVDGESGEGIAGAGVQLAVGNRAQSIRSKAGGTWSFVIEGKPGDTAELIVTKEGYDDYAERGGRFPRHAVVGWTVTLGREGTTFRIEGRVTNTAEDPPAPLEGAAVEATIPADPVSGAPGATGATTTGAGGEYAIVLEVGAGSAGTSATVTASAKGKSASRAVTVTGAAASGVDFALDAPDVVEWTISGQVVDGRGAPLPNATVTGGPVETVTDGAGAFAFDPVDVTEALDEPLAPSYSLIATVTAERPDGTLEAVASSAVAVTFDGRSAVSIVLTIEVEVPTDVTVTGQVTDANGIPLDGATVSSDLGPTAVTAGGGRFTIGPFAALTSGAAITLTPTLPAADPNDPPYGGGSVTVTYEGRTPLDAGALVVPVESVTEVTLSGTVVDVNGRLVEGASVTVGDRQTDAADGTFSVGGLSLTLGETVTLVATVVTADGEAVSGSATAVPREATTGGIAIRIPVEVGEADDGDDEGEDSDDLDDALDDVGDDGPVGDLAALRADFDAAWDEARLRQDAFYRYANAFDQRLRELDTDPCASNEVAYDLVQARDALDSHDLALDAVTAAFAPLFAALTTAEEDPGPVNARYQSVVGANAAMRARVGAMGSRLATDYGCDEDDVTRRGEEVAEGGADPDDIASGVKGADPTGLEICGDGLDNDGDNEIDECDAGCCEGRAVVIVSDCGSLADDVFLAVLDTGQSGVTPVGSSTTFSADLSPGTHSVTLTVLSAPDNAGTYCLEVIVDGVGLVSLSGGPPEGTVVTETFVVPEPGPASVFRANPVIRRAVEELLRER